MKTANICHYCRTGEQEKGCDVIVIYRLIRYNSTRCIKSLTRSYIQNIQIASCISPSISRWKGRIHSSHIDDSNCLSSLTTVRNSNCGKVMFSQACQDFCPQGVYPTMQWGRHPLGRHPPSRHPPPRTPRDTVNKRAVRILLECILLKVIILCSSNLVWNILHRNRMSSLAGESTIFKMSTPTPKCQMFL